MFADLFGKMGLNFYILIVLFTVSLCCQNMVYGKPRPRVYGMPRHEATPPTSNKITSHEDTGNGAISNAPTSLTHTHSHPHHHHHHHHRNNNSTGDLNSNGVPNFEIDITTPTLEELLRYGGTDEDDTMDYILRENAKISTGLDSALIEGDVFLGFEETAHVMANPTNSPNPGVRNRGRRWINAVVPYLIDWTFDAGSRARIQSAIDRFHETTCIRFVPRIDQTDFIHFVPRQGCWSSVGRQGGRQEISVGGRCNSHRGTIMHEIMHALGFHHEQTRPDRDDYVIIYWGNIQEGMASNFDTYPQTYLDSFYTAYDYYSIMHYPMYAFSRNGQPTMITRLLGVTIGNRNDLSLTDLDRIRHYYDCGRNSTGTHNGTTGTGGATSHVQHSPLSSSSSSRPQALVTEGANNPENEQACMDHNPIDCPHWAHRGECQMNEIWMNVNCQRSCQQCNATVDPLTGVSSTQCSDNHVQCADWASRGECNTSPQWMRHNCMQSCNQCGALSVLTQTSQCRDYNVYCDYWARNGECQRNPAYMRMQCKQSCSICNTTTADDSTSNTLCFNHSLYCDAWAQRGECHQNPTYMLAYCRKSCLVC